MTYTDISSTAKGDNASTFTDYSVASKTTDAASGTGETRYTLTRAAEYLGYYKTIPELKQAIDSKTCWTIGKGYTAPDLTILQLLSFKGIGVDTFNSILRNMDRMSNIYGDAFAEIIKMPWYKRAWNSLIGSDEIMVNLKPLDPSTITIVANEKGIITRYEQTSKAKGAKVKTFQPDEIFHLCRNRIADEIHGISIIDACEWIILARNEAMADYKKLLHRNLYPVRLWHLDTDMPAKISSIKATVASAKYEGEDIFFPKGSVETELTSVPANSILNPLPWIQQLNQYFYQAVGVPQIIIGGSQELTQTAAQIAYMAFEQVVEESQLFIEEQVLAQLNIEIELQFPASLQNNLLSDQAKDGTEQQQLNQPSQMQPPMERGEM